MKNVWMLGAAVLAIGLYGCPNTAEGVKEDAAQAGQAASDAAKRAEPGVRDAAKDATAAMVLTPKVKSAIAADAGLNDTRNTINVDSADNTVHLRGHVISEDLKKRAGDIAQKVLTDGNSTDKLNNELKVVPPGPKR
jgi:osmotically-inducible protein OsmY